MRTTVLLAFLIAHPGTAFTRAELLERVWGWDFGDQSTVTVHVRRLREKIEPDPARPVRIATRLGVAGEVLHAVAPRVAQIVMNTAFRMFPDSSAARGEKEPKAQLSPEAIALQQMMRGIHF